MNAQNYTQKSLEAIQAAQKLTIENQNQQIEQIHLLAALLKQENGLVPQLLKKMGITLESFEAAVDAELGKLPRVTGSGREADKYYVARAVDTALNSAEDIAKQMKDEYVSVEHLFLSLIENADATLKNLFRYQEYNITHDNGKNNEQYLDYCEIFVVLKDCFPEADEPLCNAGFLQLSNLAEYCFEHAESGGRIPLTADGIAKTLPLCLFDVSSQEIPIWRNMELDKCDFFGLTKRYSVIWNTAEKAASKLLLTDISKFVEHGEELVADLLTGDISEIVRVSSLDIARKLLVYAVKCRFESLLCENVGAVLHEYLNE